MKRGKKLDHELDRIAEMYTEDGLSLRQIAAKLGKTHQCVSSILRARGVEMRPCPAKGRLAKDEVIFYRGRRYTWSSKGYWRCTEMNDRHNLARRIWEENFGPIPKNHEIFYKDGNRHNIDAQNLGCLSRSDRQKQRLKDKDYKALVFAYGCYARLQRSISDSLDPSRAKERGRKIWETRRARGSVLESVQKAHATRKALYGPSGCKDPEQARKNMSEAHKGKPRPRMRA